MSHRSDLTIAPRFTLPTQKGEARSLGEFLARGPVLLAFHRGTWCPNCRRRFGELAHNSTEYARRGFQIVAIVAQRSEPVRRYIEETGLPFNILLDETREVSKAYGVWHRVGIDAWNIARPAVFLIDPPGNIRYSFVADHQDEFPSAGEIEAAMDGMQQQHTSPPDPAQTA